MHSRLSDFIDAENILYDLQNGFRKKYSTNHAILIIIEGIKENLDKGQFSCGVFVDLEKAFDTVNHKILLKKLDCYGIRNTANDWLRSYLSSRKQLVSVEGKNSKLLDVTCGVPQGSILGPLNFIIYINDMRFAINHSTVHHFADDTNLLHTNKCLKP